jgi:hypothetical protein
LTAERADRFDAPIRAMPDWGKADHAELAKQ